MKIIVKYQNEDYELDNVSKSMLVKKLRANVKEVTGVEPKRQYLMFGGKVLVDGCDLCDYKIQDGYTLQLLNREMPSASTSKPLQDKQVNNNEENANVQEKDSKKEIKTDEPSEAKDDEEKENKAETDMSEEERKSKIKEEVGEDLLEAIVKEEGADYFCKKCKNDDKKNCKECGCTECGGKTPEDKIVVCDECEYGIHFYCLEEPIEELPEGDWYCPLCRNDPAEIVKAGDMVKYGKSRIKMPSRQKMVKRDWGSGNATAGRTKTCTIVGKDHFGPIPGIEVGMSWQYRIQVSEVGVHRPPVAGIAGNLSMLEIYLKRVHNLLIFLKDLQMLVAQALC